MQSEVWRMQVEGCECERVKVVDVDPHSLASDAIYGDAMRTPGGRAAGCRLRPNCFRPKAGEEGAVGAQHVDRVQRDVTPLGDVDATTQHSDTRVRVPPNRESRRPGGIRNVQLGCREQGHSNEHVGRDYAVGVNGVS